MRFAQRVFFAAGVYGLIVVLPLFAAEGLVARIAPPPPTHPEYYYGLASGALGWQVLYFVVAYDPVRFRPLILLSALAKTGMVATTLLLLAAGRMSLLFAVPVGGDLVFALLFVAAHRAVRDARA